MSTTVWKWPGFTRLATWLNRKTQLRPIPVGNGIKDEPEGVEELIDGVEAGVQPSPDRTCCVAPAELGHMRRIECGEAESSANTKTLVGAFLSPVEQFGRGFEGIEG